MGRTSSAGDAAVSWRLAQGLWAAAVAGTLAVWLGLPALFTPPADLGWSPTAVILLGIAAFNLIEVAWFRARFLAPSRLRPVTTVEELLPQIAAYSLVTVALALSPTILAVVGFIVTGNRTLLSGAALLGLGALALARPRLDRYRELVRGPLEG